MYEHNALGYWSGLALCLTKVRSSRASCPATALISFEIQVFINNCIIYICQFLVIVYFDMSLNIDVYFLGIP